MARKKQKKDKTSIVISVILHVVLIGAIAYWAYKTGKLEQIRQAMLQYVRSDKKQEKAQPVQQKAPPPAAKLPPINQGMAPKESSGTRRAVASDAPASAGDSFFQDTRKQVQGPGGAGGSSQTKTQETKVIIVPPPAPRPAMRAAAPTTIKKLLEERQKEAASVESFGSEQISKSGVSDAGDIVGKVAGATIVDGKFAVIRGLSDRYVATTLNGGEVPSPDPYRRSASLDMFPAQVISKVSVAKTFTPDQPGGYTGGGIDIVTKSFPERPFISASIGGGYNTQATGNERFLTYDGGNLDWLGMDDGSRELPDEAADKNLVLPQPPFSSLPPGRPGHKKRVHDAELLDHITKLLGSTTFAAHRDDPPLNHNFAVAAGETTHFLGRPLGVFAGLNYKRDFNFYEDGIAREVAPNTTSSTGFSVRKEYADSRGTEEVNWAASASLAYQLHDNHQLAFNFLQNQNSEDTARLQEGTTVDEPGVIYRRNRLHFIERSLQTLQLKGSHVLPALNDIRLDWLAARSTTSQDEPDVRFFNDRFDGDFSVGDPGTPEPRNPTRYFRSLDEENQNIKLDLTYPFKQWNWLDGMLKIGVFDSSSDRTYFDREFFYVEGLSSPVYTGDPNRFTDFMNLGNIASPGFGGSTNWAWKRYAQNRDSEYIGDYKVQAGYWMVDMPVAPAVRIVGGLRAETTDINIFSRAYLDSEATGESTNTTRISEADLLPSANVILSLRKDMNLRFSFSQTLARPSFRELAAVRSYDPILDEVLEGNPLLQMVDSQNLDLRWEWFFGAGELFSMTIFYKEIQNAIEKEFISIDGGIVTFDNRDTADVMGLEFELRKNLGFLTDYLEKFSLGGNLSLIQSSVALTDDEFTVKRRYIEDVKRTRPLFDQSPYILNLDLSYDNPRSGTSASIVFNVAGPRISITSLTTEDIYEQPAPMLDFIISQKLGRHLAIKFAARNLLNPDFERTYGEQKKNNVEDEDGDLVPGIYRSYSKGMTFSLGLNYEF